MISMPLQPAVFPIQCIVFSESGRELQHELVAYRVQRLSKDFEQAAVAKHIWYSVVVTRRIEGTEANWMRNSTDYVQQVGSFLLPRFCVYVIFS